jgi:hypothetical protein
MRNLISFFVLFLFLGSVVAYDVIESGTGSESYLKQEIELQSYDVIPLEIKKSIIDVMIKSRWEIIEQQKHYLIGEYDGRSKVKISIDKDKLTLSEVPTSVTFKQRWMNSLRGHIVHRLKYYHHVRQANRLL